MGLVPRRLCIEHPCRRFAEPGKARCAGHEAELQRHKWARNPNPDMGYHRLKRLVVLPVPCAICGEAITHFGRDGRSHTFDHITLGVKLGPTIRRTCVTHTSRASRERSRPVTARLGGPLAGAPRHSWVVFAPRALGGAQCGLRPDIGHGPNPFPGGGWVPAGSDRRVGRG